MKTAIAVAALALVLTASVASAQQPTPTKQDTAPAKVLRRPSVKRDKEAKGCPEGNLLSEVRQAVFVSDGEVVGVFPMTVGKSSDDESAKAKPSNKPATAAKDSAQGNKPAMVAKDSAQGNKPATATKGKAQADDPASVLAGALAGGLTVICD